MEEMITIPKRIYDTERKMRFFGASSQDVYEKKFNIFIGISITNKKLTPKMIYNYLEWALMNAKDRIAVVIADELNIVNYEILDKYSHGKAVNRARKVGDSFVRLFEKEISKFSISEQKKIKIYKWKDVRETSEFLKLRDFVDEEYGRDSELRSAFLYFIRKFIRKRRKEIEDPRKLDILASYIVGELPTLLQGIRVDGTWYNLCLYPTYFESGMSQLVFDIHNEELEFGKKVKKILKKKIALVEAWLD